MAALAVSVRRRPPYSLYELMMNGPHCAVLLYTARETLGMGMWVSAAGHEAVPGALTSKPWPLRPPRGQVTPERQAAHPCPDCAARPVHRPGNGYCVRVWVFVRAFRGVVCMEVVSSCSCSHRNEWLRCLGVVLYSCRSWRGLVVLGTVRLLRYLPLRLCPVLCHTRDIILSTACDSDAQL